MVFPVAYKLHLLTPDITAVSVLQITNGLPLQHRNCRVTQHAAGGGRDQNQDTLNWGDTAATHSSSCRHGLSCL